MSKKTTIPVEFFSDIICPWCLIGKRKLEKAAAMHGGITLSIQWRAFLLNPQMRREGMSREDYVNAKFGVAGASFYERVANVGQEAGIDFQFDRIKRTPDSRPAHGLIMSAGNKAEDIAEELFNSYFINGLDIGDDKLLKELASRYSLSYPASETINRQIEQDLKDASRLGIQGVPFFIFNGEMAISGAHPPESFLPVFDAVIARIS
tara:strand:- start:13 stop:633 length:621 start_codon:yes stop_codon:yes gene_type:complete